MRAVKSCESNIGVHAGGHRFDAQFERREHRHVADAFGRNLIHGNAAAAQVAAGRSRDGRASQESASFHVMAIAGVRSCIPELGDYKNVLFEGSKWLKRRR